MTRSANEGSPAKRLHCCPTQRGGAIASTTMLWRDREHVPPLLFGLAAYCKGGWKTGPQKTSMRMCMRALARSWGMMYACVFRCSCREVCLRRGLPARGHDRCMRSDCHRQLRHLLAKRSFVSLGKLRHVSMRRPRPVRRESGRALLASECSVGSGAREVHARDATSTVRRSQAPRTSNGGGFISEVAAGPITSTRLAGSHRPRRALDHYGADVHNPGLLNICA